jgi:hypothetical protein
MLSSAMKNMPNMPNIHQNFNNLNNLNNLNNMNSLSNNMNNMNNMKNYPYNNNFGQQGGNPLSSSLMPPPQFYPVNMYGQQNPQQPQNYNQNYDKKETSLNNVSNKPNLQNIKGTSI